MKTYVYAIGFVISVVISVLGGVALHFFESEHEFQTAQIAVNRVQAFLSNKTCMNTTSIKQLTNILQLASSGGIRVGVNPMEPLENHTNWDVLSTVFLALQVIGSVGYGNAPPLTTGGRVFCVFYGIIGIPIFIVTLFGVGNLLSIAIERIRQRLHRAFFNEEAPPRTSTTSRFITACILFGIGLVLFVVIPSGIFVALEDWTYAEALYCSFITTLTIGYGDFVPGAKSPAGYAKWYRLAVGFWILLTLLWYGGVIASIRVLFKFDKIREPLEVNASEEEEKKENKIHVPRNWRKQFDKQWSKVKRPAKQIDTTNTISSTATSSTTLSDKIFPRQAAQIQANRRIYYTDPTGNQMTPGLVSTGPTLGSTGPTSGSHIRNNVTHVQITQKY